MRRQIVSCILACLFVSAAAEVGAQPVPVPSPTPASTRLAWDHDGVNTDRYELVVDGGAPVNLGKLVPVSGQQYETPFPALTPGLHSLIVRACNISGCAASAPFPVSVVVQPTPPGTLRIVSQ
jgi:hypothetical protein